jgi:hypothetical protein
MHKVITAAFSGILSTIHLLVLLGIAGFFYSGMARATLDSGTPSVTIVAMTLAAIVAYVLFAGICSVLLRINQNLERVAGALESWPTYDEDEQ